MKVFFAIFPESRDADNFPLTKEEISWLDDNERELIDVIVSRDLLPVLRDDGTITKAQYAKIQSQASNVEVNKLLLDVISRRRRKDLRHFCRALESRGQEHVAYWIERGVSKFIKQTR